MAALHLILSRTPSVRDEGVEVMSRRELKDGLAAGRDKAEGRFGWGS
jgi:hypothetical protein